VRAIGTIEDYQPDELVVALPDHDIVRRKLTDLHISTGKADRDERLGLALLPLDEGTFAEAADELRGDAGLVQRATEAKWPRRVTDDTQLSDLDLLLRKLREEFSAVYDGWMPDIGKNRMIAPVRGFPIVDGCARDNPRELGIDDPIALPEGGEQGWRPRPTEPGHGVRVGLLDTRLYPHPWLAGGYLASAADLLELPGSGEGVLSLDGHGTFVAGLILSQAPGAELVVRPVLGRDAAGQDAVGKTWDVAKGMAQFAGSGVDILNLSFGCYTDDGQPPLVLARAVSLLSSEILLVAAAGNYGDIEQLREERSPLAGPWTKNLTNRTPVWPAAFADVVSVGATDGHGERAAFSPEVPWVDVTAPGVDVESTYLFGQVSLVSLANDKQTTEVFHGFARWQGTSFAAGNVSGAVAAKIEPGRNARQALEAVLADPDSGVKRFKI
jgi:subtilisin family serine protease